MSESESHTVGCNSLRLHELYSSWDSPSHNTGVGSHSLLQEIFPTQGSKPGLPLCRLILNQLSHDMVWIVLQKTQGQRKGMKLYRLFQCICNKIALTIVKTKWYIYLTGLYINCIVSVKLSMSLNMLRKNIWKYSEEMTSEKRSDFQEEEIQLHKNTHYISEWNSECFFMNQLPFLKHCFKNSFLTGKIL